jgi:hypothetical protein
MGVAAMSFFGRERGAAYGRIDENRGGVSGLKMIRDSCLIITLLS